MLRPAAERRPQWAKSLAAQSRGQVVSSNQPHTAGAGVRKAASACMTSPAEPHGHVAGPSCLREGNCFVEIQEEALDVLRYTAEVAHPGAGAIASFIGVTRDSFQGKAVEKLEYEAYVPMALRKLLEVCTVACQRWDLRRVAAAHRTGTVRIGEASVVIVASSPHRRDALEAVHWAIDELKATVPIWKKEFFEGGEVWKENEECRRLLVAQRAAAAGGGGGPART